LNTQLIFEKSRKEKTGIDIKEEFSKEKEVLKKFPEKYLRKSELNLPGLSEPEVVRHFTRLSQLNFGVDTGFYPLGSCTMKYNPKINEKLANESLITGLHPLLSPEHAQSALKIIYELEKYLCSITGMDAMTAQPAAGAHGELTGLMIIRAYHKDKGNLSAKKYIIIPDSAHGTNPASVAMAGFKTITVKSNKHGMVDVSDLKKLVNDETAGLMITNPNTLGIFETDIQEIANIIHSNDGLLHYDGANLNAIIGIARPGDMGFDIVHLNLHKTFSTPHGCGGPGSGPTLVKAKLKDFLPWPHIKKENNKLSFYKPDKSIGKVMCFFGNFQVLVKALLYLKSLSYENLKTIAQFAVLNANYLKKKLENILEIPYQTPTMHEFVASAKSFLKYKVKALDIAKRLLDYGFHAPTVYFPLIVKEALMIEPTETESLETLDKFVEALKKIKQEAETNPELLHIAPTKTPVSRPDEVMAARKPDLVYKPDKNE